MSETRVPTVAARRRGRPPSVSRRQLELIALQLFTEYGYEHTTVDMIATTADTSRRTFFRYFPTKESVLWRDFEDEIARLKTALAATPPGTSVMDAIRTAVVAVNHFSPAGVAELRTRMALISATPELAASAARHYDAWERTISAYVAERTGAPVDSLYPLAVGRTTLAACRAAVDQWVAHGDADLAVYLDDALRGLARGFATV